MAGLHHGWSDDPDSHADFRHGGVPLEDFEDTFRHKKKAKKKSPTKRGCPENDNGAHVYVWTTERVDYPDYGWGRYAYEVTHNVCCGCGKRNYSKRSTYRKIT